MVRPPQSIHRFRPPSFYRVNKNLSTISDFLNTDPLFYCTPPSLKKKFFSKIVNDINVKKVKKFKRSNVSHFKV